MKKILIIILILSAQTGVFAECGLDIYEEYAPMDGVVVITHPMRLEVAENSPHTERLAFECSEPVTARVCTPPQKGEISLNGSSFIYLPDKNASGCDSFSFQVCADGIYSNISSCEIFITDDNNEKEMTMLQRLKHLIPAFRARRYAFI